MKRSIAHAVRPLLVGALLAAAFPAAAATVSGTCNTSQTKFISSTHSVSTTATSYVTMPDASFSFTQGGKSKSCVVVFFSARLEASNGSAPFLSALLDDSIFPTSQELVTGNDGLVHSYSAIFVFPSVASGHHTMKMRWHGNVIGGSIQAVNRNTVLQYSP